MRERLVFVELLKIVKTQTLEERSEFSKASGLCSAVFFKYLLAENTTSRICKIAITKKNLADLEVVVIYLKRELRVDALKIGFIRWIAGNHHKENYSQQQIERNHKREPKL